MRTDMQHLINICAGGVHRRYRTWTEPEDLRQEMWAWAYAQPSTKLDELSTGFVKRRLWDVGLRYARREKAVRSGYDADDEQFYSIGMIRDLLPWIVDPELPFLRGVDDRQTSNARRTAAGPGMEWETVLVDLRKVYSGLSEPDQLVLIGQVEFGMSEESDLRAVLRKIQRRLGGRKPRTEAA